MDNQTEKSEILVKAMAQGFSIAIHGRKSADGSWICSIVRNEITMTDVPISDHVSSLGERRDFEKTDFELDFEQAFRRFDQEEWFLCHPGTLHADFAEFVINAFDERMAAYNEQFPADSPMETFIRENKTKEWKAKAASA
ncbi:hypothetical protein KKI24_14995 [bacterium]|nr:hypothetical protein [bacterium]